METQHHPAESLDLEKLIPKILSVTYEEGQLIISFQTRSGTVFDYSPEELDKWIQSERGSGPGTIRGTDQALDIFERQIEAVRAPWWGRISAAKSTPYMSILPSSFFNPETPREYGILEYEEKGGQLKFKSVNFHALANYITDNFPIMKVLYPKRGVDRLMHYSEGVYVDGTDHLIKFVACQLLGERATEHYIRETVNLVRSGSPVGAEIFLDTPQSEETDRPRSPWVCLQNGIINVHTREFKEHTPGMAFTHKLNVRYDPAATCPEIDKFFNSSLDGGTPEGAEKIRVLKEFAGFTLDPGYRYHKALMNVSEGRSGKGTYGRLIDAVLGSNNVAAVPLQQLDEERFAMSALFGKRANIAGELSPKTLKSESKFKSATGQDSLTCEFKGQNHFAFYNDAKMIFSCNQLPPTEDNSPGFWSRWILITWPHNFEAEGVMDTHLDERLHTEAELSGFFNQMLDGLKNLRERGGFGDLTEWQNVRDAWNKLSDTATAFVEECLDVQLNDEELNEQGVVTKIPAPYLPQDELYRVYQWYCQERRTVPKAKAKFYEKVRELTGSKNNLKPPKGSPIRGRPSCFKGLKWSEDTEEEIMQYLNVLHAEDLKKKGKQTTL